MNIQLEDQIGEIVAHDFRAAAVFKSNGIDFCCRGHRTLQEAINDKGLVAEDIMKELEFSLTIPRDVPADYSKWKTEYLIDHLIEKHHAYIRQQIPVITSYLEKIVKAHGQSQPAFLEIHDLFTEGAHTLLQHLESEEGIVFPMIRDLASLPLDKDSPSCVPMNFFQQMISTMELEHVNEGRRWEKIAALTQKLRLQPVCNTTHVAFSLLQEFYEDLTTHIHIENNILFPGAMELKTEKLKANRPAQVLSDGHTKA